MDADLPTPCRTRRRLLLGVAGCAAGACALPDRPADAPAAAQPIPIRLSDYPLVFAPLRLLDQPVLALVDTGSSGSVRLSARLARQLGVLLAPVPGASLRGLDGQVWPLQRGRVASMTIGGVLQQQVEVEVSGERIESISAQVGTTFDVVLGWGFLSRQDFVLDYPRRQLWLAPGPGVLPQPAGAHVSVPYRLQQRLPLVDATVAGQPVALLVDTGSPMCNLDTGLAGAAPGQVVERMLQLGQRQIATQWRVKDMAVTRQALGAAGTLGNSLLSGYALGFDVRRQTLLLA